MSIEARPYIGTFALNGKRLVQYAPDALVYINGSLTLPGCPKCSGRIDIQKYLTEVSVDAGVDPGSASASFTLSIPLHHTDSFARDARFILRPGLEVHVYMRGYFPVAGLYSHLAEPHSQTPLVGAEGASVPEPPSEPEPLPQPTRTRHYSVDLLTQQRSPDDPTALQELETTIAMMETLHQYLEQQGLKGVRLGVPPKGGYLGEGHVQNSQHYEGSAVDLVATHVVDGKRQRVNPTQVWASIHRLRSSGRLPRDTGIGMYLVAGQNPNPDPVWSDVPHMDHGGRRQWIWSGGEALGKNDQQAWEDSLAPTIADLPEPNSSVSTWKQNLEGVSGPLDPKVSLPRTPPPPPPGEAGSEFGPSLLEELGLENSGVEKALAHPYYHVFHGVVTETSHSYSGGVSTITVNCSSMLHFWAYHNMNTNASVFGARPSNSKLKMSLVGHNFTGMHPYEIMYTLYHDTAGAAGGVGWALSSKTNQSAVAGGESLFSLAIRYWEKRFQGRNNRLRMHGATGELFSTLAATWLSRTSSSRLLRAMRDRYAPKKSDGTKKILSQARSLGLFNQNRRASLEATKFADRSQPFAGKNQPQFEINVLEMQAYVSNLGNWGQVELFESTYESKLDVAQAVMQVTGFEFFQDVDGDFVFKPPFWNMDTSSSRVYCIEDVDIINISMSDKEPEVTYITGKGSQFHNQLGHGVENEWGVKGQYIDYRLVAQFGWRPATFETAYFTDPKSVFWSAVSRMDVLNIGITSASITIPERPELRPGFPVYIRYLDCFYYCNSFSHSHSVGGQCTTSLQLVGKRAKFYAPGESHRVGGKTGIEAIHLGDTLLPERPLEVLGPDGKPRLSGFPNVVMALDPTDINPLFFVVGMDIENITDQQVLKYLLKTGVELQVLKEGPVKEGSSEKVYFLDSYLPGVGGADGTPTRVAFHFDETDLRIESGRKLAQDDSGVRHIDLKQAALTLDSQMRLQEKELGSKSEQVRKLDADIQAKRAELQNLRREEKPSQSKIDKVEKELEQKEDAKRTLNIQLAEESRALEASWLDPAKSGDVAFLLDAYNQVSEVYRSQSNFQNRLDLGNSINVLDMLSDKKAIFSDGTQPGRYRYFSASHPDPNEQGPRRYHYESNQSAKVVTNEPEPIEEGTFNPTVLMYEKTPQAPFPGAKVPETSLSPGKPVNGIRVLNSNPAKPDGEVLPTSDILELSFTSQPVTTLKQITTSRRRGSIGALGKGVEAQLQGQFSLEEAGGFSESSDLESLFRSNWDAFASVSRDAIGEMDRVASDAGFNLSGFQPPHFPNHVQVFKVSIPVNAPLGAVKGKHPLADIVRAGGAALASSYYRQLSAIRTSAGKKLQEAGASPEEIDTILGAFNAGLAGQTGATVDAANKVTSTRGAFGKASTFSPVFPVSDDRGYSVVGSYRYGRGVDIEPQGVFDQLHKYDVFSLVDKNLVEQVLRFYVTKTGTSITITEMEQVILPNSNKVTRPVQKELRGAAVETHLNNEMLRQLRAANLTDAQIIDFGLATRDPEQNQLVFNLANYFADSNKDGVQKVPVINAAYSLADLSVQQDQHVCTCKAAEAHVLLSAFGQEQFLSFVAEGEPTAGGFVEGPLDPGSRWVGSQMGLAAGPWGVQQQALRGQVLDRGGSHLVQQVKDTFGGRGLVGNALDAARRNRGEDD